MILRLLHGDCLERMAELPSESVRAILVDPPYGLEFMHNEWDTFQKADVLDWGPTHDKWAIVPGAGAFSSPRPRYRGKREDSLAPYQEWMARCFRGMLRVLVPKGIVKSCGGTRTFHRLAAAMEEAGFQDLRLDAWVYASGFPKSLDMGRTIESFLLLGNARFSGRNPALDSIETPGRQEVRDWEGWGTALKPAWEPILVGWKP